MGKCWCSSVRHWLYSQIGEQKIVTFQNRQGKNRGIWLLGRADFFVIKCIWIRISRAIKTKIKSPNLIQMLVMGLTENSSAKYHLNPLVPVITPFLWGLLWEKVIASQTVANDKYQLRGVGGLDGVTRGIPGICIIRGWLPSSNFKGDEDKNQQRFCLSLTQAIWTEGLRWPSPSTQHGQGHFHCCL